MVEAPFPVDFLVTVDTGIFSREVVLRTCHAFTDRCHRWLQSEGSTGIFVGFRLKDPAADPDVVKGEFGNALVDFGLRASIEERTSRCTSG